MSQPTYRKKLIEVDLPLDDINRESAREKSIRHGHPSTLHLWWARRPLAACRAVIFASLVDDPSSCPEELPTESEQAKERERLHDMIRELVKWENTDESKPEARELIANARYEIARSVARSRGDDPPDKSDPSTVLRYLGDRALPIYDPFAGGGSIPLEAQRLGLRAIASDLNPVAVLINKALIELPPKFNGKPPVNPAADPMGMTTGKFIGRGKNRKPEQIPWRGAAGLADDIRYYGKWMRDEAFKRIGHLYPKAKLPDGGEATVIAWLWARTVPCPNPACGIQMPLMATFQLSKKAKNQHWTRPEVDQESKTVSFVVQNNDEGIPLERTVIPGGKGAVCVGCSGTVPHTYIREQSKAGNMGEIMTSVVAEGRGKRVFLSPTPKQIECAKSAKPKWRPRGSLPVKALGFRVQAYGFTQWHQLFTERQVHSLTEFAEQMQQVRLCVAKDCHDHEYAEVVVTYLSLAFGRDAHSSSRFARWHNAGDKVSGVFARQAISMIWDFAEANHFSDSSQNWMAQVEWVSRVVERLPTSINPGRAHQADASTTLLSESGPVIVTDPPYYDNIAYADLSDFFYIWMRPLLRDRYPDLFAGITTPKDEEMIAEPTRFEDAHSRFEDLLRNTLRIIRTRTSSEFPSSIFYAYKQQEEKRNGTTSTGWETMLSALVDAGFQVVGTWPMRTEMRSRLRSLNFNALASSIILVCRPRPDEAPAATRREFLDALQAEMPAALNRLTHESHIAPTDLAQAAIGPGMEIYSRFSSVSTISGEQVTVGDALVAINQAIDDYHQAQEGEIDAESRFCIDWLKQHGFAEGAYGEAEVLSQARNVAVESDTMHGLLTAEAGQVKLRRMDDFGADRPLSRGMTAWEGCMRMAWHLNREAGGGVDGAASVARQMAGLGGDVESVERLARILYNHYDRTNDSQNAVIFNNLVTSWQDITNRIQEAQTGRLL